MAKDSHDARQADACSSGHRESLKVRGKMIPSSWRSCWGNKGPTLRVLHGEKRRKEEEERIAELEAQLA